MYSNSQLYKWCCSDYLCTQKWNCRVMRYIISSTLCDIAKLLSKLYCFTYPHIEHKFHLFHILAETWSCWTITFFYLCKWMLDVTFLHWCACMSAKLLQSCLTLWDPIDCSPPGSSVHGDFLARILKNTGVGCHALLQGIFPTQGLNPRLLCLLHWQVGFFFLPLMPPGKPCYSNKPFLNYQ